ncbi:MAG TPA: DinB family protein [Candidatus Sulfotelmatobacter sp.]|nr:DinB family protein [Candidatus Sulfotelmatobacter sp.]
MSAPQPAQPALSSESAMGMRESALRGLSNEMELTKKVIGAIPEDKKDYRPDPKARTAWELAWHLASCDVQMTDEIADQKFEMEPRFKEPNTVAALVEWYDANFKRAINRVHAMTPEQLCTPVNFYGAFNFPAVMYLPFVNNHSIHHRGQLSVYLRPMGSKVPAIYGGSADEPWQG